MLSPPNASMSCPLWLQAPEATASTGLPPSAWHPPSQTHVNNLTLAVNGTGTYDFLFNSSRTPDEQYGVYNYCNMPHVRRREYVKPPAEYQLLYVELMHRHHKRTPYAENGFPVEADRWDCDGERLHVFSQPAHGHDAAAVYRQPYTSEVNPFTPAGWGGSCQFPQITDGGLLDSWQHGADLYDVYHSLVGLLPARGVKGDGLGSKVQYRVTNNPITSQVAGMVVNGMWDTRDSLPLLTQASGIDSLEPRYPCPRANALFSSITSGDLNPEWQRHLDASKDIWDRLDGISGVPPDDPGFHVSFDHYFDNLSARQCHEKPLPCELVNGRKGTTTATTTDCVSQDLADAVYRLGNWEYSQMYRDNPDSLAASAASLGVWISELTTHMRDAMAGKGDTVYFHNVAHDGSVSRLLSILQIDRMVWPGMGSEVVFELYRKLAQDAFPPNTAISAHPEQQRLESEPDSAAGGAGAFVVRVLFGGAVLKSSSPALGHIDMLPVEKLLAYLDDVVGQGGRFTKETCQLG